MGQELDRALPVRGPRTQAPSLVGRQRRHSAQLACTGRFLPEQAAGPAGRVVSHLVREQTRTGDATGRHKWRCAMGHSDKDMLYWHRVCAKCGLQERMRGDWSPVYIIVGGRRSPDVPGCVGPS